MTTGLQSGGQRVTLTGDDPLQLDPFFGLTGEVLKDFRKRQVTDRFRTARDSGIVVSGTSTPLDGARIETDADSRQDVTEALTYLTANPTETMRVVTRALAKIDITLQVSQQLYALVSTHFRMCLARERDLYDDIDAAADDDAVKAIDIEMGWPS